MSIGRAVTVIAVAGAVIAGAVAAGALPLQSRLLSTTEMPAGWTKAPISSSGIPKGSCLYITSVASGNEGAQFHSTKNGVLTVLVEFLVTGKSEVGRWQQLRSTLAACRNFTYPDKKHTVTVNVAPLSISRIGTSSSAYSATFVTKGVGAASDDIVLFRAHLFYGILVYGGSRSPNSATFQAFALAAAAKAGGERVSAPKTTA